MTPDLLLSLETNPLFSSLPMFAMMGAIVYFMILRPQQNEEKAHKALVAGLQKGDKVVTSSGIHGVVQKAEGDTLVIELSPGTQMTVDRDAVKRKIDAAAAVKKEG